ncbi:MAG TPA: c-type cytochrome biogenesis protein CcsB [Burkholderiaceae bacterium]|nr:c-type cytochrome biogenesis protein CcsB [Burkholderiaceae bacterium]
MQAVSTDYDIAKPWFKRLTRGDWLHVAFVVAVTGYVLARYAGRFDVYELGVFLGVMPALVWLGLAFKPLRLFLPALGVMAMLGISAYGGDLTRADQAFALKYFLSSQSAILWMCAMFVLATVMYWIGIFIAALRPQAEFATTAGQMGTWFTWVAVLMGFTGLMVRWYETHLMGPGMGYIPVSNLYEVFVLFALITALFHLHYERRALILEGHQARALGGFVLLVITAAVGFLLWYTFDRGAHEIQPLVPALQSWWMKIHVPANFIGYGTFSLAAMVAYAYLIKQHETVARPTPLFALWLAGAAMWMMFVGPGLLRTTRSTVEIAIWATAGGALSLAFVAMRSRLARLLPSFDTLDDVMYKAIAVGFAFFTIATILGALWAAEAWGTYWQWDPKETWALIVWLNYAAWLHLRLVKGLRGTIAAYWALVGLLITGFAFLGVNMFLSGLHSYGQL